MNRFLHLGVDAQINTTYINCKSSWMKILCFDFFLAILYNMEMQKYKKKKCILLMVKPKYTRIIYKECCFSPICHFYGYRIQMETNISIDIADHNFCFSRFYIQIYKKNFTWSNILIELFLHTGLVAHWKVSAQRTTLMVLSTNNKIVQPSIFSVSLMRCAKTKVYMTKNVL